MAMKTILFVSSLIAAALVFDQAAASSALYAADPGYMALSIRPDAGAPAQKRFLSGSECGADRASPIWGPGGQALGYECLGNANGN